MARATVEDCIDKVDNRFELVLLASHRARQISQGASITIDRDNDKNPVVALREIADETLSPDDLKEDLIHSLQKHVEVDEPEPDPASLISSNPAITYSVVDLPPGFLVPPPRRSSPGPRQQRERRGPAGDGYLRPDVRRRIAGRYRRPRSAGKERRLLIVHCLVRNRLHAL